MFENIFYFNKLRKYLGLADAVKAFLSIRITKTGRIAIKGYKYQFKIRCSTLADNATFNEVVLRKEYAIDIPFIPETIIDGGANIGLTSLFFTNRYPAADIVAIEPAPDNYQLLLENIKQYHSIYPMQSALWSHKALLKVVDPGRGANGYVVEETDGAGSNVFSAISIADVMKAKNWDTIDILKLDVEGSEKEIFTSRFDEWLPKTKVLIVETHDRFVKGASKAVFSAVSKYNFSCKIKGYNLVLFNDALIV